LAVLFTADTHFGHGGALGLFARPFPSVAAMDEALMLAQDRGGSMEYVHGAGIRYAHLMAREHGAGLDVLRAIKRALDPENRMNPGKIVDI
jgi:FAD/FMN-containing dehydrogenase